MSVADTQASNKHVVTELFEACFNHGDLERPPRPIAEGYQAHNGQTGPPAFASTITQIRTTLSGLHCGVRDIVAEGDQVAVRWRLAGTQDGSFRGFPPTHRKIETIGIAIFTLENRKIVRASILTDQLGFLQQSGTLPREINLQPHLKQHQQPLIELSEVDWIISRTNRLTRSRVSPYSSVTFTNIR